MRSAFLGGKLFERSNFKVFKKRWLGEFGNTLAGNYSNSFYVNICLEIRYAIPYFTIQTCKENNFACRVDHSYGKAVLCEINCITRQEQVPFLINIYIKAFSYASINGAAKGNASLYVFIV